MQGAARVRSYWPTERMVASPPVMRVEPIRERPTNEHIYTIDSLTGCCTLYRPSWRSLHRLERLGCDPVCAAADVRSLELALGM